MSGPLESSGRPELLVVEPLMRTEIKIGYARLSSGGQKLDRQIDALAPAGCRKIFADKKAGKTALRPELKACHASSTPATPSLDRYGRSLQDLINMVAELRDRGNGFTSLHANLDTATPGGRLVFHVFVACPRTDLSGPGKISVKLGVCHRALVTLRHALRAWSASVMTSYGSCLRTELSLWSWTPWTLDL
ncbi:recombinase family protein [Streptomyces phaeochromogenes]|uniref:recombinase family protein n=1 Tax=Streptomyces phaeochromogenes TaxID=1923 RepID=UPI003406AB14|nr:recombinase family protein [Streptomyces phaeochromogenes]